MKGKIKKEKHVHLDKYIVLIYAIKEWELENNRFIE